MPDVSTCGPAGGFEQLCVHLSSDMYIRHLEPFGNEKRQFLKILDLLSASWSSWCPFFSKCGLKWSRLFAFRFGSREKTYIYFAWLCHMQTPRFSKRSRETASQDPNAILQLRVFSTADWCKTSYLSNDFRSTPLWRCLALHCPSRGLQSDIRLFLQVLVWWTRVVVGLESASFWQRRGLGMQEESWTLEVQQGDVWHKQQSWQRP